MISQNSKGKKNYDELEFSDDFMFGKTMEDRELCRDVLECLLGEPVGELLEIQTQREFRFSSDSKPIRLDVYNRSIDDTVYDTEMENLNKKNVEWHALPKRSRFYQSAIDTDFMDKNDSYKKLPDSKVIFICTFDPFGLGKSVYSFRESCDQCNGLPLNDGTEKRFYNCLYEGDDIPDELRDLYDYIKTGKAKSDLAKRIEEAVDKAKKNETWRAEYVKERVVIMEAREEGREEERENTERERKRADEAEKENIRLREEIERLKAGLA
ncbi:MAG: Rpn family recombination-promoting nuclease/putative transposase [Lachnospiraceae bacterium]|nr:Rpn family recombination-promoting nuclease/putative transposase [Lachnospiraceae bacterium]